MYTKKARTTYNLERGEYINSEKDSSNMGREYMKSLYLPNRLATASQSC
jgi:hypothetical protein